VKILRLATSRVLLWAHEGGLPNAAPFEVSKVVDGPLQARCPSAPRCPGEGGSRVKGERPKGSIDPDAPASPTCAYTFELRGDCLRARNQLALEAALFRPGELLLTRRLLEALGFTIRAETVDVTEPTGPRVLAAHGALGKALQVRMFRSPSAGPIVLVRPEPSGARRALPLGGRT
jgi:hypothetical protein